MKKLIAWLSKGSKISKIMQYVYKALVIASSAAGTAETVAGAVSDSSDAASKLSAIKRYIDLAAEYIGKIMEWLGVSAEDREAYKRSLLADAPQARDTPEDIEEELKKIVEA